MTPEDVRRIVSDPHFVKAVLDFAAEAPPDDATQQAQHSDARTIARFVHIAQNGNFLTKCLALLPLGWLLNVYAQKYGQNPHPQHS